MDGWNTILSYWVSAYFQVRLLLVSGRVTSIDTLVLTKCWGLLRTHGPNSASLEELSNKKIKNLQYDMKA